MEKKGRRARSMRGQPVDFDLMEIHAQLSNQPKPTEVSAREEFIESRLNRRLKRRIETQKKREEELKKQKELQEQQENETEEIGIVEEKPKIAIKEIKEKDQVKAPEKPLPTIEDTSLLTEPKIRTIKKKKIED